MTKRPNIIIINPDEMRWNTMGHMGNPAASTPNLDAFAQNEAVSFENAYCQNPVCVPSRCSFFTGMYPHVNGYRTMHYLMHDGKDTLFAELRKAGYKVWMNARNDFIAANVPGAMASQFDEFHAYAPGKGINARKGHGVIEGFPYSHYIGVVDEVTTDMEDTLAACERIRRQKDEKDPLCLFIGWMNPHVPYVTDREHYDRIDPAKIPERVRYSETEGKSEMIRKLREFADLSEFPEEKWKDLQRIYLAQCSYIDDMFGMIISALKEAGIYDDTAVFFLSDHGDFAGDFDLPEKAQNSFEDILTKVPLLIKPPKGEAADPGKTSALTELVDFYATVMDYAGEEPGHDQFGVSLRPVIENRQNPNRQYVFCEGGRRACEKQADEYHKYGDAGPAKTSDYWAKMNAEADDDAHEKGTMICDGRYKYVLRLSGKDEFYDLKEDPQEKYNRIQEERYASEILRLKLQMLKWYQETCDTVAREYDSRFLTEESIKKAE
ncbi:MAG: sulfatase-like hydrolase/transferase [Solobacterium sp.]|nr:sulfatase-like hydrolase/transferase [Solobacterium sp.]